MREYFIREGHAFDIEPRLASGRAPDFLVHTPSGQITFEATEITGMRTVPGTGTSQTGGLLDIRGALREKINEKSKQTRGAERPVVIGIEGASYPIEDTDLLGLILGQVYVDDQHKIIEADRSDGRVFTSQRHTHVSAVAFIEWWQPWSEALNEMQRWLPRLEAPPGTPQVMWDLNRAARLLNEEFPSRGLVPRLVVADNPWATRPLPANVLCGAQDVRYGSADGVHYGLTHVGKWPTRTRWGRQRTFVRLPVPQ